LTIETAKAPNSAHTNTDATIRHSYDTADPADNDL
jgi:hypothetical protein